MFVVETLTQELYFYENDCVNWHDVVVPAALAPGEHTIKSC